MKTEHFGLKVIAAFQLHHLTDGDVISAAKKGAALPRGFLLLCPEESVTSWKSTQVTTCQATWLLYHFPNIWHHHLASTLDLTHPKYQSQVTILGQPDTDQAALRSLSLSPTAPTQKEAQVTDLKAYVPFIPEMFVPLPVDRKGEAIQTQRHRSSSHHFTRQIGTWPSGVWKDPPVHGISSLREVINH